MQNLSFLVLIDKSYLEIDNVALKSYLFLPSTLQVLLMNSIGVLVSSRQWEVAIGHQEIISGSKCLDTTRPAVAWD